MALTIKARLPARPKTSPGLAFQKYLTKTKSRPLPEQKFSQIFNKLGATADGVNRIARDTEVSSETVSRINQLLKVRSPEQNERIARAERNRQAKIEELFQGRLLAATLRLLKETSLTMTEIAGKVGIDRHTVAKVNRRHKIRSEEEQQKISRRNTGLKKRKVPRERVLQLLNQRQNGSFAFSLSEVAGLTGLSASSIYQISRKFSRRNRAENAKIGAIAGGREQLGLGKIERTRERRIAQGRQEFNSIIQKLKMQRKSIEFSTITAALRQAKEKTLTEKLAGVFFADWLFRNEKDLYQVMHKTGLTEQEALEVRKWALAGRNHSL